MLLQRGLLHWINLTTKTRLVSWGLLSLPLCCLCTSNVKSRDHLKLRCGYSIIIWCAWFDRLSLSPSAFFSWSKLLSWTALTENHPLLCFRKSYPRQSSMLSWNKRSTSCTTTSLSRRLMSSKRLTGRSLTQSTLEGYKKISESSWAFGSIDVV